MVHIDQRIDRKITDAPFHEITDSRLFDTQTPRRRHLAQIVFPYEVYEVAYEMGPYLEVRSFFWPKLEIVKYVYTRGCHFSFQLVTSVILMPGDS